jgi:uncharacterized protein involved in outer membrane biogenesis
VRNIVHHFHLHRALRFTAVLVASLLAAVLYVAWVGVSIDAGGLRDRTAALLTEHLGREVRLDGPLRIRLSAHPSLVLRGLHVANAAGFTGGDFASVGEARLALDLWPLLRSRFLIEELSGSDVHLRLQRSGNGSGNWAFRPPDRKPQDLPVPAARQAENRDVGELLPRLEIQRVSLQRLDVEFIGADGESHFFELQSLVAQFPAAQPLTLSLRGTIEKTYPYQLEFTGGTLADLARLDKPMPIDLTLGFMNSRLSLNGSVSASTGSIRFGLGTANLREFERLLQTRLPVVGATGISGVLNYSPGRVALVDLTGQMGKTTLNGSLEFDYGSERPAVKGDLVLPVLDLRPFIAGQAVARETPPTNFAEVYRELTRATFSLKDLNRADADLTLRVGQWLSLPGSVHDAMLRVKLEQGRLRVPVQATVAGVALSGSASADASMTPPRFDLALGTRDSSLGDLAALLSGIRNIKGTLGRFDLHVTSRGDRGSELMHSLDVRLDVEHGDLTYGNGAGERPVRFSLDELRLRLPTGRALQVELQGSLLDTAFHANLHSAALADLMQQARAPIDFELQAGSARATIQAVVQAPAQGSASEMTFGLSAPHSSEIAGWLGLRSEADAPVGLHGKLHTDSGGWHLSDCSLQLGRSSLSADVSRALDQGKSLTTVQLTGELVDAAELQTLLPEEPADARSAPTAAADILDIPILPRGINLADSDIEVRIKRIATGSPLVVRDVRFDGRIRDGMMNASPFAANVADIDFSGAILLDLRAQPHSAVWLSADGLDIGSMLKKLGIARNIDASVDHLSLQLDLHSRRLGHLLAHSNLAVDFQGGHLAFQDPNTRGKLRIALESGGVKASAGAAVHVDMRGAVDGIPVSIAMQTATARDLVDPTLPVPFEFVARTSGASITLSGAVDRPFSDREIEFALDIKGSRLDTLNALTGTSLPPWGPWAASGKFRISRSGYEMSSLLLQVGTSYLTGHGRIDTSVAPPRVDVTLAAPTIQLDDFRFGDWSPEEPGPDGGAKRESLNDLKQEAAAKGDRVQQIFSPEVLRRQNASLTVSVDQVISGSDVLGNGKLEAGLDNGHVVIGPVVVNIPGGSASLRLGYKPRDTSVGASLRIAVKHFDYGILARRIDPKTEMRGILSLDVDVSARAQYISELLRHGKGHIDFAVWPQNLKSGLLDLWAVNVLMALLPAVDSSSASKVNCAIGRFVLNDGKLSEKTILIDTSRMRVTGKGKADFKGEDIDVYVEPRAKAPQFLSFPLPVELSGRFTDFHVGVRAADVAEMLAQFATSIVWVPVKSLFGTETPSDGHDVCAFEFN